MNTIPLIVVLVAVLALFFSGLYILHRYALIISREIRDSVKPHFIEASLDVRHLSSLAVDVWRLEKKIDMFNDDLSEEKKTSLINSVNQLKKYLSNNDIRCAEYNGHKHNSGMNIDVLSIEESELPSFEEITIKETIEPAVFIKGQLINKAKVILLKGAKNV